MSSRRPTVAIIGAGFGGLGMAIMLKRAGFTDFTVFEQAGDIGGVWRENTYPGAACDVPSPLYSFSFAPNRAWPRRYSTQPDILDYLRRTAKDEAVLDRVRLNTEVTGAEFDSGTGRWRVETGDGETFEADVLIPAVGQLSRRAMPDIPGADTFAGEIFHSAEWNHEVDLAGKRVAVIGTGASAIQFVPQIQPKVARLTVFQRSAPYVIPKADRAYTRWHHRIFRALPLSQLVGRLGTWSAGELLTMALTSVQPLGRIVELLFRLQLRRQVPDARLRARLIPDYRVGCKRVLFSNDWFPALAQPNVEVVTDRITGITPAGVRTEAGEHEADVIVFGTGFKATEFLAPMHIRGAGGRELSQEWAGGAHAYLGISVPDFPNMFLIYGPNTNLGGNSIIYMMEHQCRYVLQILREIAVGRVSCVDVRRDVAERFDAEVQQRLSHSVWSSCRSWYREENGRISTNWPGLVWEYHRRTARADLSAYRERAATVA
ncbi:NAD(P)/FAD-dependent oxidoreductase [Amycolatopsis acidiphila]|uniref:NAD(P)/FAD-dependent oxidoreductase n=1 Tax=Amycolatopsis acidiphila TaxID=715473 RepID=A0A558A6G5_9PSEU|nr:NAD(P)/FAD-dependent oxidoreductase [Amycolatopsis acidiphila]TVT19873.1 NAD(P)/FAD-dependent oxidoreductase [Amycolatopsis acidiphila]UIJ64037.1 NAD(P)/FAD-dependent oxidoreductase [Amycolatopsis acidiphila]GHG71732.1 flavin-binding monooxygenase [Amycolatopsis acidiphila]